LLETVGTCRRHPKIQSLISATPGVRLRWQHVERRGEVNSGGHV
jgi:hypothetical protein